MNHLVDKTGITVIGVGEVDVAPDTVIVDLAIAPRAATVADGSSIAATKTRELIETLTGGGVSPDDIRTSRYSISPEYDYRDGEQRLLGYRVTNSLRLRIRDIDSAGEIIDASTAVGGDDLMVTNVGHEVSEDTGSRDNAREAAWGQALAKARDLARLSGTNLGSALSIVELPEGGGSAPVARMAALAADTTPIAPGASTIRVTLEVRFALE